MRTKQGDWLVPVLKRQVQYLRNPLNLRQLGWRVILVQMNVLILISKHLKNINQVNILLNKMGAILLQIYVYNDPEG